MAKKKGGGKDSGPPGLSSKQKVIAGALALAVVCVLGEWAQEYGRHHPPQPSTFVPLASGYGRLANSLDRNKGKTCKFRTGPNTYVLGHEGHRNGQLGCWRT